MTPTSVGYSLDIASKVVGWPSSLFAGEAPKVPIWTTKYILAMNYSQHTERSLAILKEVELVNSRVRWHTVRKVVWAVSIVLPILHIASRILGFLASFDPALNARLQHKRKILEQKKSAEERSLLAQSIRDFAGLLLTVGAVAKTNAIVIHRTPDEQLARFKGHFSKVTPQEAIALCCKVNIDLLKSCYTVDLAQKEELKAKTVRAFQQILSSCKKNEPLDWMKGATTSPLYQEWLFLTANREAFFKALD